MSNVFYLPDNLLYLNDSIEKTDDDSELQIYSYKSCTNDSSDELKAYRGLVFDENIFVASSLGYTPEYNETDFPEFNLQEYSYFSAELKDTISYERKHEGVFLLQLKNMNILVN